MNQTNEKLGAIRRKKAIYLNRLKNCESVSESNSLQKDIDELSKEEKKLLIQLDSCFGGW